MIRFLILIIFIETSAFGAHIFNETSEPSKQDNGEHILEFAPTKISPPPNMTIEVHDINDIIPFLHTSPGTKYAFRLYFSNSTVSDLPMWTAVITIPPDPPCNLSVNVRDEKTAQISWKGPRTGEFSGFKMKVFSLTETIPVKSISLNENSNDYILEELTPGSSYQVQLFTVYDNKESVTYISRNFTTKPNQLSTRSMRWSMTTTNITLTWAPLYPTDIFSHYRVSIDPPDARESLLYVERNVSPDDDRSQVVFTDLIPGKIYNISFQTVSEDEVSTPIALQFRTVPLAPSSLTYDKNSVTSNSVRISWEPPKGPCEFHSYEISVRDEFNTKKTGITRSRDEPTIFQLTEGLTPGRMNQVEVRTLSGERMRSEPATLNVMLKPLPVKDLISTFNPISDDFKITWKVDNSGYPVMFKISYDETESANGDSFTTVIKGNEYMLNSLLPGRNYSISVQAISNGIKSDETTIYQVTRPSCPIIEELKAIEYGLDISWKSKEDSRQENYIVIIRRNDSSEEPMTYNITQSKLKLKNLHPGAGYHIKLIAVSHDLESESLYRFQAVYPRPPRNLTVKKLACNSLQVLWEGPANSIVSEYLVRFRTENDENWSKLQRVKGETKTEISNMTPGEEYLIQVNTVSYGVESMRPLQVTYTIPVKHTKTSTARYMKTTTPKITKLVLNKGTKGDKSDNVFIDDEDFDSGEFGSGDGC